MAENLLESEFNVIGYDIRGEPIERLRELGGEGTSAIKDVVRDVDLLLTSLPNPDAVEDVFCSDGGVLKTASDGLTVIEMSTSRPELTRAIADVGQEEGIQIVDAPVSGGTSGARTGSLTLMIGAKEGKLDQEVEAVLDTLGSRRFYLGAVGTGHTTKLVNNILTAGHRILAMEALTLGVAQGVSPENLYEVITNASGSSNQFEKRVPRVLNRNFEPTFTVDLTMKDVELALESADDIVYPMTVTSLVHELHKEASSKGYGDEDACAVIKIFEENIDTKVEAESEVDESYEGY
jgi:3-hydroxyisobutyrate dehydrogenase-like beta-hydroxyacid dehydrogenase